MDQKVIGNLFPKKKLTFDFGVSSPVTEHTFFETCQS